MSTQSILASGKLSAGFAWSLNKKCELELKATSIAVMLHSGESNSSIGLSDMDSPEKDESVYRWQNSKGVHGGKRQSIPGDVMYKVNTHVTHDWVKDGHFSRLNKAEVIQLNLEHVNMLVTDGASSVARWIFTPQSSSPALCCALDFVVS